MSRTTIIMTLLLALLLIAGTGIAQKIPQPNSVVPCCHITAINRTTGLITAYYPKLEADLDFMVRDRARLRQMKIGQSVNLDLAKQSVAVQGMPFKYELRDVRRVHPTYPGIEIYSLKKQECIICALNCIKEADSRFPDGGGGREWSEYVANCQKTKGCNNCHASTVTANPAAEEDPAPQTNERWEITRNPDLKGAMGRITIVAPEKAVYTATIFKGGTEDVSASLYVGRQFLLLPGEYDIRWWNNSEWKLRGVPVKRGMDTRIRVGMLKINLPSTNWVIYDETKTKLIEIGYSNWQVGLPIGKYYVKVNNDFGQVVIKDGEIAEF